MRIATSGATGTKCRTAGRASDQASAFERAGRAGHLNTRQACRAAEPGEAPARTVEHSIVDALLGGAEPERGERARRDSRHRSASTDALRRHLHHLP
jgi:hypothetical protein